MKEKRRPWTEHIGSSIDDFLIEEGILEAAQAQAVKEVVTWKLGGPDPQKRKISASPKRSQSR
ncbi:MAG TPA: hypothetical protein VGI16_10075 [Candidatus Acidoferrum sp.]|jgi:hypothetical protein